MHFLTEEKINFISVNITTYNREWLLKRALESVIRQKNIEMEIIVINDCSEDNTKDLLNEYKKKDSRIISFSNKKNMGNAYSRNFALKKSRGQFIAFMDDDDEWIDSHKLDKQLKFLNENPQIRLLFSNVLIHNKYNTRKFFCFLPKNIKSYFLGKNNLIYSPTVLTYKNTLLKINGFDENIKKGVDSDLFRNLIIRENIKIDYLDEFTTKIYEDHEKRMTNIKSRKQIFISLHSQIYTLKKYFFYFFIYPLEFARRIYYIVLLIKKLL